MVLPHMENAYLADPTPITILEAFEALNESQEAKLCGKNWPKTESRERPEVTWESEMDRIYDYVQRSLQEDAVAKVAVNGCKTVVVAVVVTYNPDLEVLGRLVDKCAPQVDAVVLVDNGDGVRLADWLAYKADTRVTLLPLGENKGIAAAQNAGIAWARSQGACQVILFDHDSEPPTDLVARLRVALADLEKKGEKVAAVGPRLIDSRWSEGKTRSPFSRFDKLRMIGCYPTNGSSYVTVDFLIASGSLIPMKALDAIGGMIEELFIDYVDIEWGVRARQAGWALYGIWDVVMEHSLGDNRVAVLGRTIRLHSPLRHYYAIRNALWLSRRSELQGKWRRGIAYDGVRRFVAYTILMPQPFKHFRFMCLGLWHGARGRVGKL